MSVTFLFLAFVLWSLLVYWMGYDMAIAKKKREAEEDEFWETYLD